MLLQLFQQEPSHVPAVPVSSGSQQATASPSGGYSQSAPDATSTENLNTLDEPVWHTIRRDLIRIYGNLILVVFPFKNRDQQSAALRNWDLWGPMVCMRLVAYAGSIWKSICHACCASLLLLAGVHPDASHLLVCWFSEARQRLFSKLHLEPEKLTLPTACVLLMLDASEWKCKL